MFCNDEQVKIEYVSNVDEEYFSPLFISSFIYLMAAELSISLLSDTSKYSLFYRLFNSEIKEAKSVDSMQQSNKTFDNFPLINARK